MFTTNIGLEGTLCATALTTPLQGFSHSVHVEQRGAFLSGKHPKRSFATTTVRQSLMIVRHLSSPRWHHVPTPSAFDTVSSGVVTMRILNVAFKDLGHQTPVVKKFTPLLKASEKL